MSRLKDLYLEEVERIQGELEEQGMAEPLAYALASHRAHSTVADRLADMADRQRDLAKERF
jgi:hypothetical protein